MRGRPGRATRSPAPAKVLVGRLSLLFLFVLALVLLFLSRSDNAAVDRFRTAVMDAVTPVLSVLSRPIDAFHDVVEWSGEVLSVHDENRKLREENARLLGWEATARRLERENQRFRVLLGVRSERAVPFVTTRIVADSGGSYVRAALLSAGWRDGVRKGQAVVDAQGLVGHIVTVGRGSARALLLSDLNSRIPVALETSGYHAIMAGDNSALPRLSFLPVGAKVLPGDRIMTSGDGGVLAPGIPVGQVVSVDGGTIRVKLFANADRLEFVRILAYRAPQIENEESASEGTR
ncbi:MAG: rod shape-determining protein MreC [Sphingomonadales bacterium]